MPLPAKYARFYVDISFMHRLLKMWWNNYYVITTKDFNWKVKVIIADL